MALNGHGEVMNSPSHSTTAPVALVTGANKGIGFHIARGLGKAGRHVLVGARSQQRGNAAVAALRKEGVSAQLLPLDVTDENSIAEAAHQVASEFGRLDALVNNAGIAKGSASGRTSELSASVLREVYETNVFAVLAVTNAFIPWLLKAGSPRIVNVSSDVGSFDTVLRADTPLWPLQPGAYGSSKTALNMLTVSYAKEFRDTPLKINAVTPGYCATDLNGHNGWRTAQQGAQAAITMALIDHHGPHGIFSSDGTIEYLESTSVPW